MNNYEIKKEGAMFKVYAFGKVQFQSLKKKNCSDWITFQTTGTNYQE